MRKHIHRLLRLLLGAICLLLLVLYLRHLPMQALWHIWYGARPWCLLLAVIGNAPLVLLKGRRLLLLLRDAQDLHAPHARLLSTPLLAGVYLASFAADNLIFGNAGLAVRVYLLSRNGIPLPTAIGVQALDKLLEAAGLLTLGVPALLLGGALPRAWLSGRLPGPLGFGLGLSAVGLVGIAAYPLLRGSLFLQQALLSALPLRRARVALQVAALTVLCWGTELIMLRLSVLGLGADISWAAAVRVMILVSLALLLPGPPANVGPFEAAVVLGLRAAGVPDAVALTTAVLYHLAHTVPVTLVGLPTLRTVLRHPGRPSMS